MLSLQPLIPQVQQNPQTGRLIREVHVRGGADTQTEQTPLTHIGNRKYGVSGM